MSEARLPGGGDESEAVRVGWLPGGAEELFGEGARAAESYDLLTVDVPPAAWLSALRTARDGLGCRFFDWLSAVDEPGEGFQVCAHLAAPPGSQPEAAAGPGQVRARVLEPGRGSVPGPGPSRSPESESTPGTGPGPGSAAGPGPRAGGVRRLLLRTTVPHEAPELPTATGVFAGAAWHERETREMFGVEFTGHPNPRPLLLPDEFEGHPLRKDFVLAARVAKAWPGAVEPGESARGKGADGAPKRRQMLPPGVPDPNEWGPLKGTLPAVPSRPARGRAAGASGTATGGTAGTGGAGATGAGRAAGSGRAGGAGRAAGERPPRRMRSASAGSASQREEGTESPEARRPERPRERRPSDAPWQRPSTGEGDDSGGGSAGNGQRSSGQEDRPSDREDRPSGHEDRSSGQEDRPSDHEDRPSGREDRSSGQEDRPSDHGDRPSDEGGSD